MGTNQSRSHNLTFIVLILIVLLSFGLGLAKQSAIAPWPLGRPALQPAIHQKGRLEIYQGN